MALFSLKELLTS